jgi:hypothetical protein
MSQQPLDYRSPLAMPTRRIAPPVLVVPAMILFGSATAVFVFLGVTWSSQLAIVTPFSAHTDGLRLSAYLAWTAAVVLFAGTCAAAVEFVRWRRAAAERPAV